jgi:Kef-type K+ transport system membrane component KefB
MNQDTFTIVMTAAIVIAVFSVLAAVGWVLLRDIAKLIREAKPGEIEWRWVLFIAALIGVGAMVGVGPGFFDFPVGRALFGAN